MRSQRLLFTRGAAHAVTDTWDGGGANSLITLDGNWVDNTAPLSDIANTDLIFAGLVQLMPTLNASFSTRSITFNNTAGAFVFSGQPFVVGADGIVNNDAQTMTLGNTFVRFASVANSTINAAVGGLTFTNTVTLPTSTLTVTGGGPTSFGDISGSAALNKTGTGTMTWTPDITTALDLTIDAGTVTMGADGTVDFFNSSSRIVVNGTSIFNINESLTLDGAQLVRGFDGTVNLAAGKTLTVQNGGDAAFPGFPFRNSTASTIAVTGAGSALSGLEFSFGGGSTTTVSAGASISTSTFVNIGASGNGTVTVTGAGSNFTGGNLSVGGGGATGTLTFSSASTGTFSAINVDRSINPGSNGNLNIQSGAVVSGTSLAIASDGAGVNDGAITITGASSTLTLNGAATTTIGAATASSGTLNVNSSGAFNSGTGLTTVNATGVISINGGVYNSNGNLTINGGLLNRDAAGTLSLDPGTTFTVQNGGDAVITGDFTNDTASTITVTGAGSTFSTTSQLILNGGSTLNVAADGDVTSGSTLFVGAAGNATVTVDGAGSTLTGPNFALGATNNTGTVSFTNNSQGTFTGIIVPSSIGDATGSLSIESGADVTGTGLNLASTGGVANTGTVTVTGAGSTLALSGPGPPTIGAASGSSGTLNVNSSGTFDSVTGLTTVNAIGTISIAGGVYNSNGNLTINGGRLTRNAAGTLSLDPGTTFTVQNGGDAVITGAFTNSTVSTIAVTGAGSTFSTAGALSLGGGSTTTVSAGASLSTGSGAVNIGTSGNGTVTVTGSGSAFTGGNLNVGGGGATGTLTFSSGSTGTFSAINVDTSINPGSNGRLDIQSGAVVTGAQLAIATNSAANDGIVTVTDAGSTLTLSGAATTTIGAAANSSGELEVLNGGTFNSGTGLTTVLSTGRISIDGGTYNSNGNLRVNGGRVFLSSGTLLLAAGTTVTVEAGGNFSSLPAFSHSSGSTINIIGTDSSASFPNNLSVNGGSTLGAFFGGAINSTFGTLRIGNAGSGVVTVDGAGSTLRFVTFVVGEGPGNSGNLTISNGAIADFAPAGTGSGSLAVNSGTLTITGANSLVRTTGTSTPATTTVGGPSGNSAILNVQSGGTFSSGTGPTTVDLTGTINLDSGTLRLNGLLTVSGTLAITGTGTIQGPGRIVKNSASTLTFPNSNSYTGGTTVSGGTLIAGAANGALGSGSVTVESAAVKLSIQSGVLSAIADNATLTLAGGGVPNVADNGFAELAAGVNEILAGLVLGTTAQPFGTYGSALSPATFQSDEFFSGPGILTVILEPGSVTLLFAGFSALLGLHRFRSRSQRVGAADFVSAHRGRAEKDAVPAKAGTPNAAFAPHGVPASAGADEMNADHRAARHFQDVHSRAPRFQ